jgi:hypothetical protein
MTTRRHGRPRAIGGLSAPVLAAALAWPGEPAAAQQDRPPPLRLAQDVAITFRHPVDGAGAAAAAGVDPRSLVGQALRAMPEAQTRLLRQPATGRLRSENTGLVAIMDPRAGRAWTFDSGARDPAARVVTLREGDGDELGLEVEEAGQDPDILAERQGGTDRVTGIDCVNWRLRPGDQPAEDGAMLVCFAADGLALRTTTRAGGMTSVREAVRVERGPLDPALFAPPPGWPVRPAGRR